MLHISSCEISIISLHHFYYYSHSSTQYFLLFSKWNKVINGMSKIFLSVYGFLKSFPSFRNLIHPGKLNLAKRYDSALWWQSASLHLPWIGAETWGQTLQASRGNSERDGNTSLPDVPLEKSICRSGSNS